jgi:DNA-binding MarR family transcriptional regulator
MAEKKIKSARKLERHFKGVSNHRRIQILLLIARRPNIILDEILDELDGNQKTFSEHTRRLVAAGLVEKSYAGRMVQHNLTPYGEIFVRFIKDFANAGSAEI